MQYFKYRTPGIKLSSEEIATIKKIKRLNLLDMVFFINQIVGDIHDAELFRIN